MAYLRKLLRAARDRWRALTLSYDKRSVEAALHLTVAALYWPHALGQAACAIGLALLALRHDGR